MTTRVFISYSQKDKAAYSNLCIALDYSDVSRFDVERLVIGNPLSDGLCIAIDECDLCIFIATKNSLESKWCLAELGAFWGASKRVLIFQADPDIKESDHPPQFRGNLWTDDAKKLIEAVKKEDNHLVQKTKDGYSTNLGSMKINVKFGRIEEGEYSEHGCLVALPANEFFDDDCIYDTRSALGAFMQHNFKGNIPNIQSIVKTQLSCEQGTEVEKKPGEFLKSYGVGKCVFLQSPLTSNFQIALVSVTTQRANEGLKADTSYIFEAATSLLKLMMNHRLTILHVPIIGSGYGGLKGEISLICMLIAFAELHRRSNVKEINIIVFRADKASLPSISEASVKRLLSFSANLLSW
ncbi:MAG: TIR domain-containing protein [Pseudanabaena sp. ELA645]|jgi:hypothetical protein